MSSERGDLHTDVGQMFDRAARERRADELARTLRQRFEEVVVISTSSGSRNGSHMHVPANPDEEDDTEVLCHGVNSWRDPTRKEIGVYPVGYLPWCSNCALLELDELDARPGYPIQADPGGDA